MKPRDWPGKVLVWDNETGLETTAVNAPRIAVLACPGCGEKLQAVEAEWRCSSCGPVGRLLDVPCFADPNYYWGEISREEMQRANRLAVQVGWQAAVEQVVQDGKLRQYICDPRRADFQYLWDLPPDSSILDIGAGWGAIATSLGANFSRVVAVEGVLERARFIQHRVRSMPRQTVEVICADFLRLPLAPAQFDAVVLNGVLEWVGLASPQGNPRDLQLLFLRRVRDLLKPSGFACVGIENRIGWMALRYGTDHSGLRYTSLMPRKMADLWCRLHSRQFRSSLNQGYRTYTYSLSGYHRLFREAGFARCRSFHAWNGYNNAGLLLPLDYPEALVHFLRLQSWEHKKLGGVRKKTMEWAARTGLWAQLASEFVFLVERA